MEMKELFESTFIYEKAPEVVYIVGSEYQVYVITTDKYNNFYLYVLEVFSKQLIQIKAGLLESLINIAFLLTDRFRTVYYDVTE